MADLASSLKALIADQLDVSIERVTDTANLKEDLNLDAARKSSLTTALLETFDITITDEDTEQFITLQDVFRYVEIKLWWYSL